MKYFILFASALFFAVTLKAQATGKIVGRVVSKNEKSDTRRHGKLAPFE